MKRFTRLLPGIFWFLLIFYLLTLPGKELPQIGWLDFIHFDKVVHISLFFALVFLWSWGIVSTKRQNSVQNLILWLAIAALAYGIAMEFVQKYWVANRSFDGADIIADGIGCFLPLLFLRFFRRLNTA